MRNNRYRSTYLSTVAVLALALVLYAGAGQARAQSGGFSLTWNTAPGGGGTSSGGQFTLQGTAGQKQTDTLQGGQFGLTSGYQQPAECTAGAAATVDVGVTLDGTDVILSWTHQTANGAYEVHRGSSPFFTPGPATLLATVFAPQGTLLNEEAAGDPAANRFYVVRAKCGGLWGDSNRTGEFSFELAP